MMAAQFNGTTQMITCPAPVTGFPVSAGVNIDVATGVYQDFISIAKVDTANNQSRFMVSVAADNKVRTSTIPEDGTNAKIVIREGTFSGAAHLYGDYLATNYRTISLNGGVLIANVESQIALTAFTEMQIGASRFLATNPYQIGYGYTSGKLSEVAIWNVQLTPAERESLSKGFSPRRIRPQSRVFYGPLIRNLQDLQRALALTPVNSPTVAAHPRVYP